MRRIRLVLAALAIVVTSLAAFAGPVTAQVYEYTENWGNQDYAVSGPDYYRYYGDDYCYYYPWDCYGPYYDYYDPYDDPWDYYYDDGLYISPDSDNDGVPDYVFYSS